MSIACPLPTPTERQYGEIQDRIKAAMMRKIYAALREATEQARHELEAAALDVPPPSHDYFAATMQQSIYCTLCGADPDTFEGGKPNVAIAIIRNCQDIARHYWGASIEPQREADRQSSAAAVK